MSDRSEIIRALFAAYIARDRRAVEDMFADDFRIRAEIALPARIPQHHTQWPAGVSFVLLRKNPPQQRLYFEGAEEVR